MNPNIKKHTLNLRSGDWDFLEQVYAHQGIATSVVVRTIISDFVDRKRQELDLPELPKDLNIPL